ncbi:MAG: hypothetical protein HC876_00500 [Chloroflexaceae bacterium]|nr:hypothetical protein [Chloroflexaceae bacterium]
MMYHTSPRKPLRYWAALALLLALWCGLLPAQSEQVEPAQAQTDARYFPETGHYLRGAFRVFWETSGGIDIFGYPITEEYVSSDTGRIVQWFERSRFELTEVNGQPYIELGRLGSEITSGRVFPKVPPIENTADRRYIPETQHIIQYGFKTIWETNGEERIFGFPISEEIDEQFPNGTWRTVQYFERARFEYWPEFPDGERVLFTHLGRQLVPPELTAPAAGPPGTPAAAPPVSSGSGQTAPPSVSARVAPEVGPPGTTFVFDAWNFQPFEQVGVWLTAPDQSTYDAGFQAVADKDGSIGYEGIGVVTSADFPDGVWSFNAQGVASGAQAVGYFVVSRAAGAAPPASGGSSDLPIPPAGDGSRLGAMLHDTLPRVGDSFIIPVVAPPGYPFLLFASGYSDDEEVNSWVTTPSNEVRNISQDNIGYDDGDVAVLVDTLGFATGAHSVVAQGRDSGNYAAAAFFLTFDYFAGPGTPRPPQSNSTVNPEEGFYGTTFQIRVQGMQPGEEVEVWTTEPHGVYTLVPAIGIADNRGLVGYDPPLDLQVTDDYYLGVYGIHFRGLRSGTRADAYFTLRSFDGADLKSFAVEQRILKLNRDRPAISEQVQSWIEGQ